MYNPGLTLKMCIAVIYAEKLIIRRDLQTRATLDFSLFQNLSKFDVISWSFKVGIFDRGQSAGSPSSPLIEVRIPLNPSVFCKMLLE